MTESPTSSSFFIARADSPFVIEFYEGNEVRFLLTGSDAGGTFELFDRVAPGGKMVADMHLRIMKYARLILAAATCRST